MYQRAEGRKGEKYIHPWEGARGLTCKAPLVGWSLAGEVWEKGGKGGKKRGASATIKGTLRLRSRRSLGVLSASSREEVRFGFPKGSHSLLLVTWRGRSS